MYGKYTNDVAACDMPSLEAFFTAGLGLFLNFFKYIIVKFSYFLNILIWQDI